MLVEFPIKVQVLAWSEAENTPSRVDDIQLQSRIKELTLPTELQTTTILPV